MDEPLRIAWLYPDLLSTYGDYGNVVAFAQRAMKRGFGTRISKISDLQELTEFDPDFAILGGAQDCDQEAVAASLTSREYDLRRILDRGTVMLAICAGYQLLGNSYATAAGRAFRGAGILNVDTVASEHRIVGYAAIKSRLEGVGTIVGFENHAGCTSLSSEVEPMGSVLFGGGNNGRDGSEGAVCGNVIATYLHGPVLPANPRLADYLLLRCLQRRGTVKSLVSLDDSEEFDVHDVMLDRARQRLYCREETRLHRRVFGAKPSLRC
jgi:CobQ-like glutamine amidotransferase family enzyme